MFPTWNSKSVTTIFSMNIFIVSILDLKRLYLLNCKCKHMRATFNYNKFLSITSKFISLFSFKKRRTCIQGVRSLSGLWLFAPTEFSESVLVESYIWINFWQVYLVNVYTWHILMPLDVIIVPFQLSWLVYWLPFSVLGQNAACLEGMKTRVACGYSS